MLKIIILTFLYASSFASNVIEIETSIVNHEFVPSEITVPAGKKIRLSVHNKDATIEEFDSMDLKREKIIPGHSTSHIILAPLKPGEYDFIGEFHEKTAKGKLIVIENKEQAE
jgi:plastocyanin